ncbi:MAG: MFS transporter [Firmicutes bacterium]|nr:MFS transporter [Bacillota bacterium]
MLKETSRLQWDNNFLMLLSGQWISKAGDSFFLLAGFWMMLSLTHNPGALGVYGFATGMAQWLSLVGGVYADRWDPKKTLIVSDMLRAMILLGLGFLALWHHLDPFFLILVAVVVEIVGSVFGPALRRLLPLLVDGDRMPAAVGALQSSDAGSQMVGSLLGGPLLTLLGAASLFFLDAWSFAMSVLSFVLLRTRSSTPLQAPAPKERRPTGFQGVWQEFLDGQRALWGQALLRSIVPLGVAANLALAPLNVLDVVWVREVLHRGGVIYGLFSVAILAGIMGGSVMAPRLLPRVSTPAMMASGLLAGGLGMMLFSQIPITAADLALLIGFGIGIGSLQTTFGSLIQRNTPPTMLGRVGGALNSFLMAANPAAYLVAGVLATALPLSTIFLGSGALLTLVAVGVIFRRHALRSEKGITQPDAP